MSTIKLTWTHKKTFSIQNYLVSKLDWAKNKSKIVNNALKLYFEREKYLENANREFFETFQIEEFNEEQIAFLKKRWKKDYGDICSLID